MARGKRSKNRKSSNVNKSPFFQPSDPRKAALVSAASQQSPTTGTTGTTTKDDVVKEHKSSILGAASNLINAIVGAGIVAMPYALKQSGLVAGVLLILFVAFITEKSLRLLIETAKHVDVPSYERLAEASFGRPGFVFVSLAMFVLSYGSMVSYLMIVKETLPILLGFDADDVDMKRAILAGTSLIVILPISCQRDMADLAKTSTINVISDCIIVTLVTLYSPIGNSVSSAGGILNVMSNSLFRPSTFFVGLGVLSFAFVCQHSGFIVAGSLERPTRNRWGKVSMLSLTTCAMLSLLCGLTGYLGFLDETTGNILNNFTEVPPSGINPANVARGLLCMNMFFVYPMESFVARHVCVVLLFQGRRAHEGEDHTVLARSDRRITLTTVLYLLALTPALIFRELGNVLAATGAVGGSCISYVGPGAAYLGVHGSEFLDMVKKVWPRKFADTSKVVDNRNGADEESMPLQKGEAKQEESTGMEGAEKSGGICTRVLGEITWYILLMPLWCSIASMGAKMLTKHFEEEAIKSPYLGRLGKVIHHKKNGRMRPGMVQLSARAAAAFNREGDTDDEMDGFKPVARADSFPASGMIPIPPIQGEMHPSSYGAAPGAVGDRAIAAAIAAQSVKSGIGATLLKGDDDEVVEDDPQDDPPGLNEFLIAIFYIIFGVVAVFAGIFSILEE